MGCHSRTFLFLPWTATTTRFRHGRTFFTSLHQSDPPLPSVSQHYECNGFHTSFQTPFLTHRQDHPDKPSRPGSVAFGECEISALSDLFLQFAKTSNSVDSDGPYLDLQRIKLLLEAVGEKPDDDTLETLFREINLNKDGKLRLECFLRAADRVLGDAPARIVLVVGGPGESVSRLFFFTVCPSLL